MLAGLSCALYWQRPATPWWCSGVDWAQLLHRFYLTTGAKFGADFLAYPGDPMGYHALYCIRVMAANAHMRALQLGAALRGAHAARKHLVLASVHQVCWCIKLWKVDFAFAEQWHRLCLADTAASAS